MFLALFPNFCIPLIDPKKVMSTKILKSYFGKSCPHQHKRDKILKKVPALSDINSDDDLESL